MLIVEVTLELVVVVSLVLFVVATLLNVDVKMTFTLKVTLLVGDVATKSKY